MIKSSKDIEISFISYKLKKINIIKMIKLYFSNTINNREEQIKNKSISWNDIIKEMDFMQNKK